MSSVKIAFASDENYVQQLAVAIASILANAKSEDRLSFYILDGGITPESKQKIEELRSIKDFDISFYSPNWSLIEGCPNVAHFTRNAYLRLLLPKLFPDISRILYLDCDLVITCSLAELFNLDMEGKPIAAVQDAGFQFCDTLARGIDWSKKYFNRKSGWVKVYKKNKKAIDEINKRLNIKNIYFNSGVLLIDLDKVRYDGSFEKTIEWVKNNIQKITCPDQDALNVIFNNNYKLLPQYWNIQIREDMNQFYELTDLVRSFYPKDENGQEIGGILHFITSKKPCDPRFSDPVGDIYFYYLKLTPWRDWQVKKTLRRKIRHPLRRLKIYRLFRRFVFRHILTRGLLLLFFRKYYRQ